MVKSVNGETYSDLTTSVNPNLMNSSTDRNTIDRIVIHHNATTNKDVAMNTWLTTGSAQTSAHYEIADGEIIGCVGENFTAWHAGVWDMNLRSIGLEHVNNSGAPNWTVSDATMQSSAKLIADICKRYNIPIDRTHIIKHSEVYATACPGGLDIDKLVSMAKAVSTSTTTNTTTEEIDMLFPRNSKTGEISIIAGAKMIHLSVTAWAALKKGGAKSFDVTDAEYKELKKLIK